MSPDYLFPNGPDRRHLQHVHTRISGDDGLGQKIIEPYHMPLLSLTPITPVKNPAILQLKVMESRESGTAAGMTNRGWLRHEVAKQKSTQPLQTTEKDELPLIPLSRKSAVPNKAVSAPKSLSCKTTALPQGHVAGYPARDEKAFPALDLKVNTVNNLFSRPSAPAVQPPTGGGIISLNGPERTFTPAHNNQEAHPVVSQKKAKKSQREDKRKTKKMSESVRPSGPTAVDEASLDVVEQSLGHSLFGDPVLTCASNAVEEVPSRDLIFPPQELMRDAQVDASSRASLEEDTDFVISILPSPVVVPHTTHGKHDHWMRFSRFFVVDQLTAPLLQFFEGCSHGSSCLFETHGVPDCPFHKPRKLCTILQSYSL